MVRNLKENNLISYEEFKTNKEKYKFEIDFVSKSDLDLDRDSRDKLNLKKFSKKIDLRIGDIEVYILDLITKEKGISKSKFLRNLILEFGKTLKLDEKFEKDYFIKLKEYNYLFYQLESKRNEREELLKLRGTDKKTANKLYYKRTKLKFEIENLKSDLNQLKSFIERYEILFSD
ncbi:hypothetical protein HMPREF0202_00960 [Cetobacterium somerae ATCC BAA-474]|uniref:Uncharacterized protein n=1 Tax=Cetobacterium somerae ATCC BAA-474 TaxID=1319815 RepID=U7VED5_9FUSO|nr:hypothetical protein [Cetobacterium somerae]ERT69133.1 hypothetical protein HMPREF0202_00960 [Cetobacterium somerae ATCC BAA-474]